MRVGILTYHFSYNYGAIFQAYALQKWFKNNGHEAVFVNYHPYYVEEGGRIMNITNLKYARRNVAVMYMRMASLRRALFGNRNVRQQMKKFRTLVLGVTEPRLTRREDLERAARFDLLVCGSDQIWNPSLQRGLDPVYFLDFPGSEYCRKISYAPSFGSAQLAPEYAAEASRLIHNIDGLSVRESSGTLIVQQVSGKHALCVPDPTILLGDFDSIQSTPPIQYKYVLCYVLRSAKTVRNVADHAGSLLDAPILSVYNPDRRWREIGRTIYPSPSEWLGYLATCSVMITNSFHGVALSLVLQRPFIAVELPGRKKGLSERIANILKQVGLENRMITNYDESKINSLLMEEIRWEEINYKLASIRKIGEDFLFNELRLVKVPV